MTTSGFNGSWTTPAASPWIGTFKATGPVPAGVANPTGITLYDFSTLPGGVLSAGTFFRFGDVDNSSNTTEIYWLKAFDISGAIISSPWLDEVIGVAGTGTGTGGSFLSADMPGWTFTSGGAYNIAGNTVTSSNPSISFYLPSNTDIASLEVTRTSEFENFALLAPVPAPGAAVTLAIFGVASLRRRTRKGS